MVFFSPQGEPLLSPYDVLKIEFGASDDEIAKAYKHLMLQLHPDKQPTNQTEEEAEEISQKFHDVKDAKSFLLDGEHLASRREYDARLLAAQKANAAHQAAQANAQTRHADKVKPPPEKDHSVSKVESSVCKSKATIKSNKPNITTKEWGRVKRPASSTHVKKDSKPIEKERRNSCGTTTECSSSDDERPHHRRGVGRKGTSTSNKHTPSNIQCNNKRSNQKKSPPPQDKPRKNCSNNIKNKSGKEKEESHATSSKDKKTRVTEKNLTKETSMGDSKPSKAKKTSKTTCTKKKQGVKSESKNHKLCASCPAFFDDDLKKDSNVYGRRSSADGKASNSNAKTIQSRAPTSLSHNQTKTTLTTQTVPSSFDAFQPVVATLTKQYHCPLTKEVMNEPMSDFEGNNYERDAILKYLETHSTSPVTGNPLYPMHLTPNSALKERIKYTLKLKKCLDTLTSQEKCAPPSGLKDKINTQLSEQHNLKHPSLRQSVDMFIQELNSSSSSCILSRLDKTGKAAFTYTGLEHTLQVSAGLPHHIVVQTIFDHDRKAAGISAKVVDWNRLLQESGILGKLTFRNIDGKFAFTLTLETASDSFCGKALKHAIEYYLEMSIKLHNTINVTDQRKIPKVRLQDSSFVQ